MLDVQVVSTPNMPAGHDWLLVQQVNGPPVLAVRPGADPAQLAADLLALGSMPKRSHVRLSVVA